MKVIDPKANASPRLVCDFCMAEFRDGKMACGCARVHVALANAFLVVGLAAVVTLGVLATVVLIRV